MLRWGLMLRAGGANPLINARSETVARNGLFRHSFAQRRCLVPAGVFYEWRAMPEGKQPYAIARADGTPLALGGIWSAWTQPAGEVIRSFAIITTAANATMRQLHNRMPLVIEEANWPAWLGERAGLGREGDQLAALLRPATEDVLRLWPVSPAVNSVRNNGPDLLERIDDPQVPLPSDAPAGMNPS